MDGQTPDATSDAKQSESTFDYEPPAIEERVEVGGPLIGTPPPPSGF